MPKRKSNKRLVSRVVLFINPVQLNMTNDEVCENMAITMRDMLGGHKDEKVSYAVQHQADSGFVAFVFRTKGRERHPMWISRPMTPTNVEYGNHIITIMTDADPESPIAKGREWEDIEWDRLRVVPWGRLQPAVFDVIYQVYRLVVKLNVALELNDLGLMISIDGDRRWMPPIMRKLVREHPTE